MKKLNDRDYELIGKQVWANRSERQRLQDFGVNVVPANFYSPIPSITEIESSYEYADGAPPYLNEQVFDAATIRETLAELRLR